MKKMRIGYVLLLALVFATGCAVGNRHAYHNVNVDFSGDGSGKVAVATHDQRDYVVSGEKDPTFVGLQRGGFGNPFNVSTASGKSLADDFTGTVASALNARGFKTVPVMVSYSDSTDDVRKALKNTNAGRSILIMLNHWKSDTYQNTGLAYNLKMEVLDQQGKTLAEKSISGDDDLKGSAWNPPAHARKVLPKAYKSKLESLLNSKEITNALIQ